MTYGELAAAINLPKSARAVGGALKRNPFAPEVRLVLFIFISNHSSQVPCHRVVGSNLALTGFQGSRCDANVSLKKKMLVEEGVKFDGMIVRTESVHKFSEDVSDTKNK